MSSPGSRVAYVRRIKSVTQAELSEATGLSADFISKIETGKRIAMSWESSCKIANHLGVTVGYLWDGTPGDGMRESGQNLIRPVSGLLLSVPYVAGTVVEEELTVDNLRSRVVACTDDLNNARYEKVITEVSGLVAALRAGISIHANEAKAASRSCSSVRAASSRRQRGQVRWD